VGIIRHHLRVFAVASAAVAIGFGACIYVPSQGLNEKKELAAQDEVYTAVVNNLSKAASGEAPVTQLVFGDALLSDREPGTDIEVCRADVRKRERWAVDAPPYDTLLDKIYRFLTRAWASNAVQTAGVQTETLEDFLLKSCSIGSLSRTFHTDLPRSFVEAEKVRFEDWHIKKNGPQSFEKLFPGASGVISFSRVGFDSGMDEAMVYASFVCGGLCGEGWHYTLKKRRGKWEVTSRQMIWVS
jgi:hypothetical protein